MTKILENFSKYLEPHIRSYDHIVLYTDFRFLVKYPELAIDRQNVLSEIFTILKNTNKTLYTPSYSYSSSGRFDIEKTPTKVSALSKWLVGNSDIKRSAHPIFSYIGFGKNTELLDKIGKSAFGHNSLYDKLRHKKAGFLHLGRDVFLGNTMIHYVEHMAGASYRYHKFFKTEVFDNGKFVDTDFSAFVRRKDIDGHDFSFNFKKCAETLFNKNIIFETKDIDDTPYMASYPLNVSCDIMADMFEKNSSIFLNSKFNQY